MCLTDIVILTLQIAIMAEPVVRDIAVKQDKRGAVIEATEQIYLLFKVIVKLSVESAGIQWVQLQGLKENAEFAKVGARNVIYC